MYSLIEVCSSVKSELNTYMSEMPIQGQVAHTCMSLYANCDKTTYVHYILYTSAVAVAHDWQAMTVFK